jgi:hypothetical protein
MRIVVFGLAFVVLGAAGVFEAKRSFERVDPLAAAAVQAKLDALPLTQGDWVGELVPYDAKQLEQTKAVAHTNVLFRNPKTKETMSLLVLAGPPGQIGAHDPNRCYEGAGFQRVGAVVVKKLVAANSSYWLARFDTDTFPAQSLQVSWMFTANGDWSASDDARQEFVFKPVLYKLYLSRNLTSAETNRTDDPIENLLSELLPSLKSCIASP